MNYLSVISVVILYLSNDWIGPKTSMNKKVFQLSVNCPLANSRLRNEHVVQGRSSCAVMSKLNKFAHGVFTQQWVGSQLVEGSI